MRVERLGEVAGVAIHEREIVQNWRDFRMVCTDHRSSNLQDVPIVLFRFRVFFPLSSDDAEI